MLSVYCAAKFIAYADFAHKYTYIIYNKNAPLSREILSVYFIFQVYIIAHKQYVTQVTNSPCFP